MEKAWDAEIALSSKGDGNHRHLKPIKQKEKKGKGTNLDFAVPFLFFVN